MLNYGKMTTGAINSLGENFQEINKTSASFYGEMLSTIS
jgi:hypothetical protein